MKPRGNLAAVGTGKAGHCPITLCRSHTGLLWALALPLLFLFNVTHLRASDEGPLHPAPGPYQLLLPPLLHLSSGAGWS